MTEQEEAERRHCEEVADAWAEKHELGCGCGNNHRIYDSVQASFFASEDTLANLIERERAAARRQALDSNAIVEAIRTMDAEARGALFSFLGGEFCMEPNCGSAFGCQCWNYD